MLQVASSTDASILILNIGQYLSNTDFWDMSILYTKP